MGLWEGENDDIKLTANIHLKNYIIWAQKIRLRKYSNFDKKICEQDRNFKSDHQIACKSLALTETTHIPNFVKNIFSSTM